MGVPLLRAPPPPPREPALQQGAGVQPALRKSVWLSSIYGFTCTAPRSVVGEGQDLTTQGRTQHQRLSAIHCSLPELGALWPGLQSAEHSRTLAPPREIHFAPPAQPQRWCRVPCCWADCSGCQMRHLVSLCLLPQRSCSLAGFSRSLLLLTQGSRMPPTLCALNTTLWPGG